MVQEGFIQNYPQLLHPGPITLWGMSSQQIEALLQSANSPNLVIALYDPRIGIVYQGSNLISQSQH